MDDNSKVPASAGGPDSDAADGRQIRWRPPIAILVVGLLLWGAVTYFLNSNPGFRNLAIAAVAGLTFISLLVWLGRYSGLSRPVRRWSTGIPVGAIALFFAFFYVKGVSGDMIPEFAPRRWVRSLMASVVHNKSPELPVLLKSDAPVADLAKTTPDDFPEFLGPDRRPEIHGLKLARDWDAQPPRELWRREVGPAWSGFAVVNEFAVTQEQHAEREVNICYELLTGKPLWSHANEGHFYATISGEGPRATPTIQGGRVYSLGALGTLNCLDGATGRLIWTRNTLDDTAANNMEWGVSCSPLVVDDLVVVSGGLMKGPAPTHSLAAYKKDTGELAWTVGNERSSYGSPLVATFCGVRQIVTLNGETITGHDIPTGRILWSFPWYNSQPSVAQPVPLPNDRFFISTGYDIGCALAQISRGDTGGFSVAEIWKNRELKSKFANVVIHDGHVYGLDEGILACLDLETGKRAWKRGRYGHGQLLLIDDVLLITSEQGDLVLIEATPKKHHELTKIKALSGKTWNNPALYGRYLLVRNAEEAACFELPLIQ